MTLREVVEEQGRDEGLWFHAETATEAYLQQALRRLHAAVEAETVGHVARLDVRPHPDALHAPSPTSQAALDQDAAWLPCCGVVVRSGDHYKVALDPADATCTGELGPKR